jgi:hypothetical protein
MKKSMSQQTTYAGFLAGLFLICFAPSATAQAVNPTPLDCGKYSMVQVPGGYTCRRTGHVPWFVGQPGVWETEVSFRSASTSIYWAWSWDQTGVDNLWTWDRYFGFHASDGGGKDLPARSSYFLRVLGRANCSSGCNSAYPDSAAGSLIVLADGPDAASLDGAAASFTYKFFAADGSLLTETTIPVTYEDVASSRWSAVIAETPLSRQGTPNTTVTAFAINNFSTAQAVRVTLFDGLGTSVASVTIPEFISQQGFLLSSLLNADLPVSGGSTDFHGTIVFEGVGGGKIAPVVLQMTDTALTAVSVNPER